METTSEQNEHSTDVPKKTNESIDCIRKQITTTTAKSIHGQRDIHEPSIKVSTECVEVPTPDIDFMHYQVGMVIFLSFIFIVCYFVLKCCDKEIIFKKL